MNFDPLLHARIINLIIATEKKISFVLTMMLPFYLAFDLCFSLESLSVFPTP